MSHTPEQAKTLWCPMARVAQSGNTDIQAAYNRSLTKTAVPVRLTAPQDPKDFQLGQEPEQVQTKILLETRISTSMAAGCIADQCAMWRWVHTTASVPTTTEGATGMPARVFEQKTVRTHGYCGIAGRPEVLA